MDRILLIAARALIGALFAAGTVQKLLDPVAAQALLEMRGLPVWLVWPATALNAALALAIWAGVALRPAALVAAGYCALTSVFHFQPDDGWQMSIFVKNWSIAGGCLALAVAARRG